MPQVTFEQAFQIALQHHQTGQLPQAEAIYRQILAAQPNHAEALHYLGVIACQTGRHDIAVDLIRRAIVLRPDWAEAHNNLGVALKEKGQLDEAIAVCRQAIALKPDWAEAHYNLGLALEIQHQPDEAIAACRQAITLKPNWPEAYNSLGNALKDAGQLDEAVGAYQQAIARKPDWPEAHHNLGVALQARHQPDEAIAACRQAITLKPDFAEPHAYIGKAHEDAGRLDDAIAQYQRALALKPNYSDARLFLGHALYKKRLQGDPVLQNNLEIRVLSMQRSGHHAIMTWAAGCLSGQVLFANDVSDAAPVLPRYSILNDGPIEGVARAAYILNSEDTEADSSTVHGFEADIWKTYQGPSKRIIYCLVLRDPYNLFASRLLNRFKCFNVSASAVELWKRHARQFLGRTNHLPADSVYILYNDWVVSKDYRQSVAARLGIPFSDRWRNLVSAWGKGSSVDELTYDTKAEQMDVGNRWRSVITDERFVHLVRKDPELHELAAAVLGPDRWSKEFGSLV